jgi:hypothetical protein
MPKPGWAFLGYFSYKVLQKLLLLPIYSAPSDPVKLAP